MVTSRFLSSPPAGGAAQPSSWSSLSLTVVRKYALNLSNKDNPQAVSLPSEDPKLDKGKSLTRARLSNRSILFARKVVTQAGVSHPMMSQEFSVVTLWENLLGFFLSVARKAANWKLNPVQAQSVFERVIVDSRFFTLLAIVGSLLGSILCFVEGFVMVLQLYFCYFESVVKKVDHVNTLELLVEAIDMFLVGTAMVIFGMGLYAMFVGSKSMKHQRQPRKLSEMLPSWLKMDSVSEAKTRVGPC